MINDQNSPDPCPTRFWAIHRHPAPARWLRTHHLGSPRILTLTTSLTNKGGTSGDHRREFLREERSQAGRNGQVQGLVTGVSLGHAPFAHVHLLVSIVLGLVGGHLEAVTNTCITLDYIYLNWYIANDYSRGRPLHSSINRSMQRLDLNQSPLRYSQSVIITMRRISPPPCA